MLEIKCLLKITLLVFATVVVSDTGKRLILPQLPVGKYRLNFLAMIPCADLSIVTNNKIKFALYLSKKTFNTTEILGNITGLVPFDDSFNFEADMAKKDSIGGWSHSSYLHKTPKAYTSIKMFLGGAWTTFMDGLGIYNATYPIPAGFYKGPGIDTAAFMKTNFPKTFFYGTYRFVGYLTKNQEIYSCVSAVVEVKRLWEND